MKRIIIALAAIVIGLGAASAQKYIVVDSEKIFRSIAQYNSAISTLDAMARDYQSKVDAAYAKVESMYNTYVSQKQSMTEAARVAQEQAILAEERKVAEYQESMQSPVATIWCSTLLPMQLCSTTQRRWIIQIRLLNYLNNTN